MTSSDHPVRRIIEASVAAVLLVAAVPAIVLAAVASAVTYRAWPFFVQDRVGRGGRTFRLVKVRSLPPYIDAYADKYAIRAQSLPRHMVRMRTLHLDELPQLWHVVAGDMAFVGPRPEMPNLHAQLPARFAAERVSVTPGLTGLWQISPHCNLLIGDRTEYDRLYIEHRNASFDLWILWRTVVKMTTGRTTHLFQVPQRAITPAPAVRFEIVDVTIAGVRHTLQAPPQTAVAGAVAGPADALTLAD